MNFLEILQERILVADGAMGTLLSERGITFEHSYDYACLTHPADVLAIHREYIAAGAELIETNTYGANRFKLSQFGLEDRVEDINRAAVRLAREAADGKAFVAGAVGPAGKPLAPIGRITREDADASLREQISALADEGVDVFLLETFADMNELELAIRAVHDIAPGIPVIAHKTFIEDGETLEEGLPARVAERMRELSVDVAGSNCTVGPQRMLGIVRQMASVDGLKICAMPTAGLPQLVGGRIHYDLTPAYFGHYGRLLAEAGAVIIGGCCGTTPAHIRAVAEAVQGMKPAAASVTAVRETPREALREEIEIDERSSLAKKLGLKYVVTVELDLPRGADISKVLLGAQSLKNAGADCIDISDGARARLRMNPMAVSHLIQERVGIDVMMHFCCRDRNLLAIQADLLGCHALGLRNILAITGDPAQIGDYPTASSVFDVDSIGLVRILNLFNQGQDLGGNTIVEKTHFLIAVAYNPLAPDQELERERLARKVAEGAQCVYTQPIFDERTLEVAVRDVGQHGLPLLVGILPLRSSRHAEFMQNEVPGISIPDDIRRTIAGLPDEDARRYGIETAQNFLARAKEVTQGAYLMPPFGNHATAEAVMQALH
jgi:homocysteine S-methyltransferase